MCNLSVQYYNYIVLYWTKQSRCSFFLHFEINFVTIIPKGKQI